MITCTELSFFFSIFTLFFFPFSIIMFNRNRRLFFAFSMYYYQFLDLPFVSMDRTAGCTEPGDREVADVVYAADAYTKKLDWP